MSAFSERNRVLALLLDTDISRQLKVVCHYPIEA